MLTAFNSTLKREQTLPEYLSYRIIKVSICIALSKALEYLMMAETSRNHLRNRSRCKVCACLCFWISSPFPYLAKDHSSLAAESAVQSVVFKRPHLSVLLSDSRKDGTTKGEG